MKKPQTFRILILALVLILAGSFLAGLFNTSFYRVKVSKISFDTDRGTLTGLLYMPKGAGPDDPRPVIVTTHGYLNTKEMQDAPAIEMSRRGYIVLALDMYDHGDSRWAEEIPEGGAFATFWVWAQFDAAQYMARQPYTLKDRAGNAYLAVSGHSMGGFSTFVAMYMDEMYSLQSGTRSIYAGIPAGADLTYAAMIAPGDVILAALGSRTVGVVAGHYDEFFFNKSAAERTEAEAKITGTVTYKDFPATAAGKTLLGLPPTGAAGQAGQYYIAQSGDLVIDGNVVRPSQTGERIIFTPMETHPWNHFSQKSTASLIGFYTHAFEKILPASQTAVSLRPENQIWPWKEFFNLVSLVGFFLLLVPIGLLVIKLPFFNKAVLAEAPALPAETTSVKKCLSWIGLVAGTAIPAIFFAAYMDKQPTLNVLGWISVAIGVGCLVVGIIKRDKFLKGGIITALAAAVMALALLFAPAILNLGHYFNEPTVNQIAYWALNSGLLVALISCMVYYFMKKPAGGTCASYGLGAGVQGILAAFCTALVVVVAGYVVLFITQGIFGVDYRIWVLAVRTFTPAHVVTALRYLPILFIYYFFNAVALTANTRGKKFGYLMAILMNISGLLLWIIGQYGLLFIRGVAMQPTQALNGILLFATIPCLAVAAVFAKKLGEKTNNAWVGAFLNAFLFTMISCANTAMFWNLA